MLGHQAKDKITGLKGILTAKAEYLYASTRYELTPEKLSEGKPVEGTWIEEGRLAFGGRKFDSPSVEYAVQLGATVKDSVSGYKGNATGRLTFMNGCVRIEVTSTQLKDAAKPIETVFFDEQRLTVTSKAKVGGPSQGPPAFGLVVGSGNPPAR